jgi:hypothetical protein
MPMRDPKRPMQCTESAFWGDALRDPAGRFESHDNPNCDGSGPHVISEVRVLTTGGDGNAILCRVCFIREMEFRKDRNKTLGTASQFEMPTWESLKVYEVD